VEVSREIPRVRGFLTDPRVPLLEERLHGLLAAASTPGLRDP
jgi:hypothetical protein